MGFITESTLGAVMTLIQIKRHFTTCFITLVIPLKVYSFERVRYKSKQMVRNEM